LVVELKLLIGHSPLMQQAMQQAPARSRLSFVLWSWRWSEARCEPTTVCRYQRQMSARGPERQFAAVQRYGRCRWNTGRSRTRPVQPRLT